MWATQSFFLSLLLFSPYNRLTAQNAALNYSEAIAMSEIGAQRHSPLKTRQCRHVRTVTPNNGRCQSQRAAKRPFASSSSSSGGSGGVDGVGAIRLKPNAYSN